MAKVTYRGVQYDTQETKSCQLVEKPLIYRGIRHTEEKVVCAK